MSESDNDGVVWVTFDGSRVELVVASRVLELMKEREPEMLGAYIGEAMCGTEPRGKRRASRS